MAVFQAGVGGSTATQPTQPSIPNDPQGSGPGFQAPQGWAGYGKSAPPPPVQTTPGPMMPGSGPSMTPGASGHPGTSNPTSPLAQTLISGPGGSPADTSLYPSVYQNAIKSNAQFAQQYGQNQQNSNSAILDALKQVAGLSTWTNPYDGTSQTASVTGY